MQFFRPELFNRMDALVRFDPLSADSVKTIARRELDAIAQREGIARLGIRLEFGGELLDRIADAGFDTRYGARPQQRTVERLVVAELAKWLLGNPCVPEQTVRGDWLRDRAEFRIVDSISVGMKNR